MLLQAGRLEEAAASGLAEGGEAERQGLAGLTFFQADALFALGRWDEAATQLALAEHLGLHGFVGPLFDPRLALLEVGRGDFRTAARHLARERVFAERTLIPTVASPYAPAAAELALWQGDPLVAREHVRRADFRASRLPPNRGWAT